MLQRFSIFLVIAFLTVGCLHARIFKSHHSHHASKSRIIGGDAVDPQHTPYIAYVIMLDIDLNRTFQCAGTLISESLVLTAAHCFVGNSSDAMVDQVKLGAYWEQGEESFEIIKHGGSFVKHPRHNRDTAAHDIGIIKLPTPVELKKSKYIKVASLPNEEDAGRSYLGAKVEALGWGVIKEKPFQRASKLMGVNLTIIDLPECYIQMKKADPSSEPDLYTYEFCTRGTEGRYSPRPVGTCGGDSGGPLVYGNTVIGVTSRGTTYHCSNHEPSIFVSVGQHLDWIHEQIKTL